MTRFEDAAQSPFDMSIMTAFCIAAYLEKIGHHFSDDELKEFMSDTAVEIQKWLNKERGEQA